MDISFPANCEHQTASQ